MVYYNRILQITWQWKQQNIDQTMTLQIHSITCPKSLLYHSYTSPSCGVKGETEMTLSIHFSVWHTSGFQVISVETIENFIWNFICKILHICSIYAVFQKTLSPWFNIMLVLPVEVIPCCRLPITTYHCSMNNESEPHPARLRETCRYGKWLPTR